MKTRFALAAVALIGTAGCVPALAPLAPSSGDSAALYARAPGDRVRITLPAAALDRQEVALLALTADSLVVGPLRHGSSAGGVVPGRERFAFSRDAVQSVEVMREGRGYYALVGAVVGYVAGAAIAKGVGGGTDTLLCNDVIPPSALVSQTSRRTTCSSAWAASPAPCSATSWAGASAGRAGCASRSIVCASGSPRCPPAASDSARR